VSESDNEASEVKEGSIHFDLMILAHQPSSEAAQPGKSPFDFPPLAVAPQSAAIVERGFDSVFPMRTDEQNALVQQAPVLSTHNLAEGKQPTD
jgi:hypothetical protein